MHLSGAANGGVCFGGFSKSTYEQPMFECYYPAYFYGGIVQGGGGGGDYPAIGTEQDTGMKWIDGKPIYRVVLQGKGANSAGGAAIGNLPTNFETVVSIGGTAKRTSTGTIFDNNYNYTSSSRVDTYISSDGTVYCRTAMNDVVCTAIIEYTKAD
jgi:hypothetical protein